MSVCQNEYLPQIQNGIKCQMYKYSTDVIHLYVHIDVPAKNLYMYIKYHI